VKKRVEGVAWVTVSLEKNGREVWGGPCNRTVISVGVRRTTEPFATPRYSRVRNLRFFDEEEEEHEHAPALAEQFEQTREYTDNNSKSRSVNWVSRNERGSSDEEEALFSPVVLVSLTRCISCLRCFRLEDESRENVYKRPSSVSSTDDTCNSFRHLKGKRRLTMNPWK